MIKEIHEQPKAVSDTLEFCCKDGAIDLSEVGLLEEEIKEISQIYIVAWICISCRSGSTVCYGRPGKNPGTCRTCIRVQIS